MSAAQLLDAAFQLGLGVIALVANALSAFAGGGAGLVQLPALILLGLPFAMALATHKLASVALGIGAASRHWREGSLDPRLTLVMIVAGVPGVWLGANLVLAIPDRWATAALGLLTLGLGFYSNRRPELGQEDRSSPLSPGQQLVGALGLFVIGVLNGSLTSGTGLFVTLWLVSWFGLSYTRAVAHTLILLGCSGMEPEPWFWGFSAKSAGTGSRCWCSDPCSVDTSVPTFPFNVAVESSREGSKCWPW